MKELEPMFVILYFLSTKHLEYVICYKYEPKKLTDEAWGRLT